MKFVSTHVYRGAAALPPRRASSAVSQVYAALPRRQQDFGAPLAAAAVAAAAVAAGRSTGEVQRLYVVGDRDEGGVQHKSTGVWEAMVLRR